jgi:hypothetical protein
VPADLAARRRRPAGAAVVLAIGARLVTAGSAIAAAPSPSPDNVAVSPPPPRQQTRASGNTKHTTRLYGKHAFQEAVSVTSQLVYPADVPTGEDDSFPDDRPRAVTLLTTDDPLTADDSWAQP